MLKLPIEELDRSLRLLYERRFAKTSEGLRTKLLDSPKLSQVQFDRYDWTQLHLNVVKVNHKIALGIMSWYMPEETRILLQFWLQEHWGGEYKEVRDVVLTSKDFALAYLCVQDRWSDRDFFGNVLDKNLQRLWETTTFWLLSQRPVKRYTGYCRGYQESSRSASRGLGELSPRVLSVEEFQKLETAQEQKLLQLVESIRKFLSA